MFYEGTLQEGISTAVGQQKLVLCFVTDENEEGQIWEKEYLRDDALQTLIQEQAVALRLISGSEEAGYLAQIFPLPRTPTVVIMKHGELKEYIPAGTSKEDFIRRIRSAFNVSPPAAPSSSASSSLANGLAAFVPIRRTPSPQVAAAQARTSSQPEAAQSEAVSRILAERAAKLKAQKEEAERRAKEKRTKAAEKAKAEAEAGAATEAASKYKQAEEIKKKRQQEEDERKRILKRIEDDREERRLRASVREQQRIDNQNVGDVASALASAPETKLPSTTRVSEIASLQVRLFDGSTIRSRFKTASPLTDVRKWVDGNRGENKIPYTFKHVLTPLPNKNIDETEETKTLGELGLVPSSTLVLIPVQKFSSAYEGGSQGGFAGFIALILSFFTWLSGLLGLSSGTRATQEPASSETNNEASPASAQARNSRLSGLQNLADRQRDQQLYNGNSLNFEPRPDEGDEK
ncbi:hypothetical protein PT974_01274 [Cladobotryum mycophilum]|uniref:UBX domain-containing protein 2 n=1 Tax=Cladobotryum mycophilum TaxID=491253 RepID=A0ABR0T373_9HYPO